LVFPVGGDLLRSGSTPHPGSKRGLTRPHFAVITLSGKGVPMLKLTLRVVVLALATLATIGCATSGGKSGSVLPLRY
jgi:hypothetical protein